MTTRGQKKTTEIVTSNPSESGVIQNMLTANTNVTEEVLKGSSTVDPATAKDTIEANSNEAEKTKSNSVEQRKVTSPVKAKDGKIEKQSMMYMTKSNEQVYLYPVGSSKKNKDHHPIRQ